MSINGESAGVHAASEAAIAADDSDPSSTNLKLRRLSWDHPDNGMPDPEYEAFVELQHIRQLSTLVDAMLEEHGEKVDHKDYTETSLYTSTARLSRVEATVTDYVEVVNDAGQIDHEIQEVGTSRAYFFIDLTRQYDMGEDNEVEYYCRSWVAEADRINYCRREGRYEPAADVQEKLELAFGDYLPKSDDETEVLPVVRRRRFNLDFLLKRRRD